TVRANSPRRSVCGSIRISIAPAISRGSKRMSAPVEIAVDLLGRLKILQLLETRESAELIRFRLQLNSLKQLAQLSYAIAHRVAAGEPRELLMNTLEAHAIAAV